MSQSYGPDASNLSTWGKWDLVIGLTQARLNNSLKQYLSNQHNQQTLKLCFVWDKDGEKLRSISWSDLQSATNNTNPFQIADGTNVNSPQVVALDSVGFVIGFDLTLGIPRDYKHDVPDLLTLTEGRNTIGYTLLFSSVQAAIFNRTNPRVSSWSNISTEKGRMCTIPTTVDLRLQATTRVQFADLPLALQNSINGDTNSSFTLQELLMNMTSLAQDIGAGRPDFIGIYPDESYMLFNVLPMSFFLSTLGKALDESKRTALGTLAVQDQSSSSVTQFNYMVNKYVGPPSGQPVETPDGDQQQAYTLNYICSLDNDYLPPAVQLPWNWVDSSDINTKFGAAGMPRNKLAQWLYNFLFPIAKNLCIGVSPYVNVDEGQDIAVDFDWNFWRAIAIDDTRPVTGPVVLELGWSSNNWDSPHQMMFDCQTNYYMTVALFGSQLQITQSIWCFIDAKANIDIGNGASDWFSGGFTIDRRKIVDAFNIFTTPQGKISFARAAYSPTKTDTADSTTTNSTLDWFWKLGDFMNAWKTQTSSFQSMAVPSGLPLSSLQENFYPCAGSNSFNYSNPRFSDNGDLIADVDYNV